jgi:PAS domain S-box-containing protein
MNIKRYFFISAFCWSLLMLVAMGYEMQHTMHDSEELALIEARTALAKDLIYRKWIVSKGGVYAPVSKNTPPNPYLQVPEQNIESPSGKELTLVNPAYMIRQVYELEREGKGIRSHITSLNPIRPQNKADRWEEKVLQQFEQGVEEYSEQIDIEGKPFFRYMKALTVQQGCLKCHAVQGYQEGEVRGGISIATPMAAIKAIEKDSLIRSYLVYLALWILGLGGLSYGSYHLQSQLNKRKETEKELEKFKQTLDQTLDCVFMFDPATLQYIYANHGAVEQVGYSLEELLDMTPLDLKPEYNEQAYRALLAPLLQGEEKSLTFTTTHRNKNGNELPVEIVQQYVALSDGKNRFVSIVRDISKRLAADLEKEKMQTHINHSQKLESVGHLAAGIAHEINTPAQFLGTNMEFLDESFQDVGSLIKEYQDLVQAAKAGKLSPELLTKLEQSVEDLDWEYLAEEIPLTIKQSREGVERISKIVRAMKEFSHPGSKDKAPVNINDIINTTMTVSSNEWKYVAEIETDLDPSLPSVTCLADEMGQVFLNILVNAAHAIGDKLGDTPDGEKGLISISSRLDEEWIEIRIKDSGKGMPDSIREHIFDPFFTTKEVGKGTGQGLAIAHSVVIDKHQGSLTCESEEGVGTSFIIRLPVAA